MDERAVGAVKMSINKAKICKKTIAGYDKEKKRAYVEYANGERKYAEQKKDDFCIAGPNGSGKKFNTNDYIVAITGMNNMEAAVFG